MTCFRFSDKSREDRHDEVWDALKDIYSDSKSCRSMVSLPAASRSDKQRGDRKGYKHRKRADNNGTFGPHSSSPELQSRGARRGGKHRPTATVHTSVSGHEFRSVVNETPDSWERHSFGVDSGNDTTVFGVDTTREASCISCSLTSEASDDHTGSDATTVDECLPYGIVNRSRSVQPVSRRSSSRKPKKGRNDKAVTIDWRVPTTDACTETPGYELAAYRAIIRRFVSTGAVGNLDHLLDDANHTMARAAVSINGLGGRVKELQPSRPSKREKQEQQQKQEQEQEEKEQEQEHDTCAESTADNNSDISRRTPSGVSLDTQDTLTEKEDSQMEVFRKMYEDIRRKVHAMDEAVANGDDVAEEPDIAAGGLATAPASTVRLRRTPAEPVGVETPANRASERINSFVSPLPAPVKSAADGESADAGNGDVSNGIKLERTPQPSDHTMKTITIEPCGTAPAADDKNTHVGASSRKGTIGESASATGVRDPLSAVSQLAVDGSREAKERISVIRERWRQTDKLASRGESPDSRVGTSSPSKWARPESPVTVNRCSRRDDDSGKPTASGGKSTASGDNPTASGGNPTASGGKYTSSGDKSTASGSKYTASGGKSTASGGKSTASSGNFTSSGSKYTASGDEPTASGGKPTASGGNHTAFGGKHTASGGKHTAPGESNALAANVPPVVNRQQADTCDENDLDAITTRVECLCQMWENVHKKNRQEASADAAPGHTPLNHVAASQRESASPKPAPVGGDDLVAGRSDTSLSSGGVPSRRLIRLAATRGRSDSSQLHVMDERIARAIARSLLRVHRSSTVSGKLLVDDRTLLEAIASAEARAMDAMNQHEASGTVSDSQCIGRRSRSPTPSGSSPIRLTRRQSTACTNSTRQPSPARQKSKSSTPLSTCPNPTSDDSAYKAIKTRHGQISQDLISPIRCNSPRSEDFSSRAIPTQRYQPTYDNDTSRCHLSNEPPVDSGSAYTGFAEGRDDKAARSPSRISRPRYCCDVPRSQSSPPPPDSNNSPDSVPDSPEYGRKGRRLPRRVPSIPQQNFDRSSSPRRLKQGGLCRVLVFLKHQVISSILFVGIRSY